VKLEFFIARHYLFSKKSTNVINLISLISIVGLTVGTAALIIILSIFNGLEELIISRYNSFDPDIKVLPAKGKIIPVDTSKIIEISKIKGVKTVIPVLEENVLVKFGSVYNPARLKGVTNNFLSASGLDSMITAGEFTLQKKGYPVALVGQTVANSLNIGTNYITPLTIYAPRRTKKITINPEKAFVKKPIYAAGIFSVEPEIDNYIIVPFNFARAVLQYYNGVSSFEIYLENGINTATVNQQIKKITGNNVIIQDRLQQHKFIYKILKSEKMITYLILTLIIILASFTLIGSLSMLIIEKEKDIQTLISLGMNVDKIKKIFLTEGMAIAIIGNIAGLLLGIILVWVQYNYGLIKLYSSDGKGNFIVDAYPVKLDFFDILLVFITVSFIGYLASKYPARFILKRYFINE